MSLLVHPDVTPSADGTVLCVTPASAGWQFVGFEVLRLAGDAVARRETGDREVCVVAISGAVDIESGHGSWLGVGGRPDPWSGPPDAAYLPPGTSFTLRASAGAGAGAGAGTGARTGGGGGGGPGTEVEVALCWAPARAGAPARVLPGSEVKPEIRGHSTLERTIHPILMDDREADSLLVCEVLTPAGHWSSYPPHKHDRDAPPAETALEETYYHRVSPAKGFGLQRVYSDDRTLDESLAFTDCDCVLVPRGYHTVSAPPGYDVYYLNVMAGPVRRWAVRNDPDHAWTLAP